MPKLKWNDCSATMFNTRCHEGRVSKRVAVNVQKKCISLGKASDRKWVDYSNSKIFIKKRPNHEYNILRQVLSRDKRISESLKYEVKCTNYSQHFMNSPSDGDGDGDGDSPIGSPSFSESQSPSIPSSPNSSTSTSSPSSPDSAPSSPLDRKYPLSHLSASFAGIRTNPSNSNLLSSSTPELSSISISFADPSYLHSSESQSYEEDCSSSSSFQQSSLSLPLSSANDPFFTEIQPLPIMELYYAWNLY